MLVFQHVKIFIDNFSTYTNTVTGMPKLVLYRSYIITVIVPVIIIPYNSRICKKKLGCYNSKH